MAAALRVLIAEDDHLIRMIMGDMVAAMGHDVCAAVSSEDAAVQQAADHRPDLIILDVTLGAGDGVRAATAILETRTTACVIVTGDVRRANGAPKDAIVLEKPFTSRSLARAIDDAWARVA
jgi:CheY-like chemotaxis protein